MAKHDEPSYPDLVYEVLRSAGRPLTFQEIFDEVDRLRPITTKDPTTTIRAALTEGRQLISIRDGRYGYLPHLVGGSLLRVPLPEKRPANHPLVYPEEVRCVLWPSFSEIKKRRVRDPIQVRLPGGDEVALSLDMLSPGVWGSQMPEGLRRYLVKNRVAAGGSLLVRVVDGQAGHCEAWYEPRLKRDDAAVAQRNRELADAAYQILRKKSSREEHAWDLVVTMLVRGIYRSDVAPDPLEMVLRADPRFEYSGLRMWILAEAVTPKVRDAIRQRMELETDLYQPEEETPASIEESPSPLSLRYARERNFADIGAFLSEGKFGSFEEANAALQEMMSKGGVPRRKAATPLEQAQDLMYKAWESSNPRDRVRLARKALEISPDCADAYVLLAEETARAPWEAADLYEKGAAAGERALGKRAFKEDVGHFWGLVETRPYMRARAGLAQTLWDLGQREESIAHAWDMLRLNPGDNQGIRYLLLNWLLETGDDAQLKKLLDRYRDDAAATWSYGRALHLFRTEGDTERARKALDEAKRQNPHVPAYLLRRKRLPLHLPEMVGFGDESEAVDCAAGQVGAWRRTPGALAWLDKRGGRDLRSVTRDVTPS